MRLPAKIGLALALLLSACSGGSDFTPGDPGPLGAGENWDNPGGDWAGSHFSRLATITPENVDRLGLAWEYDLGTSRVQESTPVVIDGVMYASGNLGRVYALNAATGEDLWTFTPDVDMQHNRYACCDMANRGIAINEQYVFTAALDGWLYALDRQTGAVAWKADTFHHRNRGYASTGAPELAGNLVVIGNGGAEYDARGYVTAYHVDSGEEAWCFYTIPHDPAEGPQESEALEAALATWSEDTRWDLGGGGTVWDAITYDPEFDQVIVGVGNGGPYPISTRSPGGGDNLYVSSLVALDRETGELKWHFQETPQDSWDFTAVQPMVLTDLEIGGQQRKVVLHTPKNGFFFAVDRETGRPLLANPLVRTSWASGWDLDSGKPILTPEGADYSQGPKLVFPAPPGARNWYPAAWDPDRQLYFAHVLDMGNLMMIPPELRNPQHRPRALVSAVDAIFTPYLQQAMPGLPAELQDQVRALPQWQWVVDAPWISQVRAIDPLTGATRWAVDREGWQDRSGMLATANGLVVYGTLSGKLYVRDAETGAELKVIDTGTSILAAPMTYAVDGVQYITVQAGWGGGGMSLVPPYAAAYTRSNQNRLLVFRLDGGPVPLPPVLPPIEPTPPAPAQLAGVSPAMIARGGLLFSDNCSVCHSNQPRAPVPNLLHMRPAVHQAFDQIVLQGLLVPRGMPRWDDIMTGQDVRAIHAYLIDQQGKAHERDRTQGIPGEMIYSRGTTSRAVQ